MIWKELTDEGQLETIKAESKQAPTLIFKHSTRCSISNMAKGRLDNMADTNNATFYYLDLLRHRSLSDKVATEFNVHHESPQLLLIDDGECVYEESHNGIIPAEILTEIAQRVQKTA